MEYMEHETLETAVKEVTRRHMGKVQGNVQRNEEMVLNTEVYTEREYQTLESYLVCKEKPVRSYEPLSRLTGDEKYIVLKTKHQK